MAGEKIKNQILSEERKINPKVEINLNISKNLSKNPFLKDLFTDLYPMFKEFQLTLNTVISKISLQERKLKGLQLFLFAVIARDLSRQGGGPPVLIQSVCMSNNNLNLKAMSYDSDNSTDPPFPSIHNLFLYSLNLYPLNW
jgi:hypothetical protein